MKKKQILILALILSLLIISLFLDRKPYNNLSLEYNYDIGTYIVNNEDNIEITHKNYQNDISKLIYNKLNNKLYTAKKPLMILNPYGTNITGLYINFFTFKKLKIEYTISIEGEEIPNFTGTINGGLTNFHRGQIIGLLQGYENTITIKLINKSNKIENIYEFKINIPNYNTNTIKKLDAEYNDINEVSDDLYITCSARFFPRYISLPISFYDKFGILRAEFTQNSGAYSYRIEKIDNKIFYSIKPKIYVLVNKVGKIEKIYQTQESVNHEIIYHKYSNSIFYITDTDKIRRLNLENGKDTLLLDLGLLLKEYKYKEYDNNEENIDYYESTDWAHLNSIEIVNENDIILSARETSSIIYISNINKNPNIKYIIAPETIYENTPYTKYLLKKEGDFPVHAGQHAVTIQTDSNIKKGEYYLVFYNNNYAPYDQATFNTNWEKIIEGVGTDKQPAKYSVYYKYLVNEKNKTYTLVESIKVPYSHNISNVQILQNGYLINSGAIATIQEYNQNKELILQLKFSENPTIYRTYKNVVTSFWFDNTYSYTK